MPYCTQDDILEQLDEDTLLQLTDDYDAGAIDSDVVDRAIADADSLINGYCGKRHTVPFTTVPALARKFSVDIAIYNLYGRRIGAPEDRKDRYKEAIDYLKGVARGENSMGEDDPEGTPPDSNAPQMSSDSPERIFTRDKMSGF